MVQKRRLPPRMSTVGDVGCEKWRGIGWIPVDHWIKTNGGELMLRTDYWNIEWGKRQCINCPYEICITEEI